MPPSIFRQARSGSESVRDCWRSSLWILEALPPTRRPGADDPSSLRRRKLSLFLEAVASARGDASVTLHQPVVPNAPFLQSLMWWARRRGMDDDILHLWSSQQMDACNALLGVAGSLGSAHAILTAFARARVAVADTDFTDAQIRSAILRDLLLR